MNESPHRPTGTRWSNLACCWRRSLHHTPHRRYLHFYFMKAFPGWRTLPSTALSSTRSFLSHLGRAGSKPTELRTLSNMVPGTTPLLNRSKSRNGGVRLSRLRWIAAPSSLQIVATVATNTHTCEGLGAVRRWIYAGGRGERIAKTFNVYCHTCCSHGVHASSLHERL